MTCLAKNEVVQILLREYLVKTTEQRVLAYRRYREQRGEYWTVDRLELFAWEFLYSQVSLKKRIPPPKPLQFVFLLVGGVRSIGETQDSKMSGALFAWSFIQKVNLSIWKAAPYLTKSNESLERTDKSGTTGMDRTTQTTIMLCYNGLHTWLNSCS